MNNEQVERLAAAWEEFEVAAKPTHFDGETEFYSIESMVEAAWEVKKIAEAAMQPDAAAIRNEALREAAGLAEVLAVEMEAYNSIPTTTTKSKAMCIRKRILALIKENTDEQ